MNVAATDSSKKWVSICQTVQCYILKDSKISINKDTKEIHPSQLRGFVLINYGILQHWLMGSLYINEFSFVQLISEG